MTRKSTQFDLRTLGLLVFCLSVGFTACVGDSPHEFQLADWLDIEARTTAQLGASLLYAAAAAMAIGLVQQARRLIESRRTLPPVGLALWFAVGWRISVAVLTSASLLMAIGLKHDFVAARDETPFESFPFYRLVPEYLLYGCMIIVMMDLLGPPAAKRRRIATKCVLGTVAGAIALAALADELYVTFLVYRAVKRVENSHAAQFRRPGAYPDFSIEGHWLFWLSAAAMTAAICGALLLLAFVVRARRRSSLAWYVPVFGIALLCGSAVYGYWFFLEGLGRISPDMAEAGWALTSPQLLETAAVVAVAIPALACRIAARRAPRVEVGGGGSPTLALHQTRLVAVALGLSAVLTVASSTHHFVNYILWRPASMTLWTSVRLIAFEMGLYVPLAVAILSAQVCWRSFRSGSAPERMSIVVFDPRQFLTACGALVLILALAVPTCFAFGFACWVGPW